MPQLLAGISQILQTYRSRTRIHALRLSQSLCRNRTARAFLQWRCGVAGVRRADSEVILSRCRRRMAIVRAWTRWISAFLRSNMRTAASETSKMTEVLEKTRGEFQSQRQKMIQRMTVIRFQHRDGITVHRIFLSWRHHTKLKKLFLRNCEIMNDARLDTLIRQTFRIWHNLHQRRVNGTLLSDSNRAKRDAKECARVFSSWRLLSRAHLTKRGSLRAFVSRAARSQLRAGFVRWRVFVEVERGECELKRLRADELAVQDGFRARMCKKLATRLSGHSVERCFRGWHGVAVTEVNERRRLEREQSERTEREQCVKKAQDELNKKHASALISSRLSRLRLIRLGVIFAQWKLTVARFSSDENARRAREVEGKLDESEQKYELELEQIAREKLRMCEDLERKVKSSESKLQTVQTQLQSQIKSDSEMFKRKLEAQKADSDGRIKMLEAKYSEDIDTLKLKLKMSESDAKKGGQEVPGAPVVSHTLTHQPVASYQQPSDQPVSYNVDDQRLDRMGDVAACFIHDAHCKSLADHVFRRWHTVVSQRTRKIRILRKIVDRLSSQTYITVLNRLRLFAHMMSSRNHMCESFCFARNTRVISRCWRVWKTQAHCVVSHAERLANERTRLMKLFLVWKCEALKASLMSVITSDSETKTDMIDRIRQLEAELENIKFSNRQLARDLDSLRVKKIGDFSVKEMFRQELENN
eukprot:977972_1